MTGVVVVNPTPGISGTRQLGAEVLMGLGKRHDALDHERVADGDPRDAPTQRDDGWGLARTWVRAEGIRHMVVLDMDRLRPQLWLLVAELATSHRTVWLVVRSQAAALRFGHLVATASTVSSLLKGLPPPTVMEPMRTASALTPEAAKQLRCIATPAYTCVLALAAIARDDPCALAGLGRRSLGVSARTFTLNGRTFAVPAHALPLVRAQLLVRPQPLRCRVCASRFQGSAPLDLPLFLDRSCRRPSPPQLAAWLRNLMGANMCRNPMLNLWPTAKDDRLTDTPLSRPLTSTCRFH